MIKQIIFLVFLSFIIYGINELFILYPVECTIAVGLILIGIVGYWIWGIRDL